MSVGPERHSSAECTVFYTGLVASIRASHVQHVCSIPVNFVNYTRLGLKAGLEHGSVRSKPVSLIWAGRLSLPSLPQLESAAECSLSRRSITSDLTTRTRTALGLLTSGNPHVCSLLQPARIAPRISQRKKTILSLDLLTYALASNNLSVLRAHSTEVRRVSGAEKLHLKATWFASGLESCYFPSYTSLGHLVAFFWISSLSAQY